MSEQDALTPLQQQATEHHERYLAWLAAGFNEQQAMYLLTCWIGNQMIANQPPPLEPDD